MFVAGLHLATAPPNPPQTTQEKERSLLRSPGAAGSATPRSDHRSLRVPQPGSRGSRRALCSALHLFLGQDRSGSGGGVRVPAAPCGPREGSSPLGLTRGRWPPTTRDLPLRTWRPREGPVRPAVRAAGTDERLCAQKCVLVMKAARGRGGLDRVGRVGDTVTDRMRGAPLG